ncbi:MAG: TetR/AcrR family transcriptional regulator [Albidovulum sp.]|uniref:TetR/AcrR family transcriptional regulator n=1 Tax=Albidovulum sp. TaxID=1872424 RepID=UPI003C89FB24
MSKLRQRKKEQTTRQILAAASRMFQELGYDKTRIEDIAALADLSAQTFYNYFPSKADVLLASINAESEAVLTQGEACINTAHRSAKEAFGALVRGYFTTSFSTTSRYMWRIALARVVTDPNAGFSESYRQIDARLTDQVCRLIDALQSKALIRKDIDARAIGELLFNNVNMNFIIYIQSDTLTSDDVSSAVDRQSATIFHLISMEPTTFV